MSPLNPLNPAAGDVPVPEDPREVDAALRAGRISHRLFPYVDWRYGERGRNFTKSDSGWLAWLTRHSQERVYEQIVWLRSVLSNRGMPSWILETHLNVLYRHLTRTVPEKETKYRCLQVIAGRLRQAREEQIPPSRAQQFVEEFVVSVGGKSTSLPNGVARLLLSAVADEKLGVKNAVGSLQCWLLGLPQLRKLTALRKQLSRRERDLLDSDSFEPRWTNAVASIVAAGRQT